MAKKMKKVDIKKATKLSVSKQIADLFTSLGIFVGTSEQYGFTEGTLVLKMDKCDVQIKLITPKAGLERYDRIVEEEEVVQDAQEQEVEEQQNAQEQEVEEQQNAQEQEVEEQQDDENANQE